MEYKVILFKTPKTTKEGKKFDSYHVRMGEGYAKTMSARVTKYYTEKYLGLGSNKPEYPLIVTLSDNDYFISRTKDKKDNTKVFKSLVINGFENVEHAEVNALNIKHETITDLLNAKD